MGWVIVTWQPVLAGFGLVEKAHCISEYWSTTVCMFLACVEQIASASFKKSCLKKLSVHVEVQSSDLDRLRIALHKPQIIPLCGES